MKISSQFNRLYHKILSEAHTLKYMRVDLDSKVFEFRPIAIGFESFKHLMKYLNTDYPKLKGKALSTTEINSKDLTLHVEWLINITYEHGGKITIIEEEFKMIGKEA